MRILWLFFAIGQAVLGIKLAVDWWHGEIPAVSVYVWAALGIFLSIVRSIECAIEADREHIRRLSKVGADSHG